MREHHQIPCANRNGDEAIREQQSRVTLHLLRAVRRLGAKALAVVSRQRGAGAVVDVQQHRHHAVLTADAVPQRRVEMDWLRAIARCGDQQLGPSPFSFGCQLLESATTQFASATSCSLATQTDACLFQLTSLMAFSSVCSTLPAMRHWSAERTGGGEDDWIFSCSSYAIMANFSVSAVTE